MAFIDTPYNSAIRPSGVSASRLRVECDRQSLTDRLTCFRAGVKGLCPERRLTGVLPPRRTTTAKDCFGRVGDVLSRYINSSASQLTNLLCCGVCPIEIEGMKTHLYSSGTSNCHGSTSSAAAIFPMFPRDTFQIRRSTAEI